MKVIKTAAGNYARKNPNGSGLYNQREIDEIKELLSKEQLTDIGVIAPYRYHTQIVMEQLGDKVDASTIHKFQGREKKTIIFSSVINDSNEFVENDNLINVAVSRAVDKFVLITSDKVAKSNSGVLSDLVNYITYNNDFGASEDGTVKSIYDLLYEDYQEQLAKFRSKHPSKDFDSENITKELIKKILSEYKYLSFGLRMHVSLKDFIYAKGLRLTDEEYKFFKNPNAHADFLIYNRMSRKPILVIEVDGVSFHEQQKIQQDRDAKKNSILEKAGIKLLRLRTNESGEEDRIKAALNLI
jgi:very-short-patch-repair endonuclease